VGQDSSRPNTGQRIVLICQMDGFANGIRPVELARFLRDRGHEVQIVDTYLLSRASPQAGTLRSLLPRSQPAGYALYAVEAIGKVTRRLGARRRLSFALLLADYSLRRRILRSSLSLADVDLLICETPYDSGALLDAGSVLTWYDCPTPWADELLYENRLTPRQHRRLRRLESNVFEAVDYLSFHWDSYAGYAKKYYGITGHNMVTMNWGCRPSKDRAHHAAPARVIYLGSLSSRFIDLPLLARLSRAYPHLDVYGSPPPDPSLGLRYLGYASPGILRDYQFGLITCTNDPLRRDGFSAKHLEYLAAGLPVLVPAWRRRAADLGGSLPYEEESFLGVVADHSGKQAWQGASDDAFAQAQRLRWERTLEPLESVLVSRNKDMSAEGGSGSDVIH